jgi:hypothetical protein
MGEFYVFQYAQHCQTQKHSIADRSNSIYSKYYGNMQSQLHALPHLFYTGIPSSIHLSLHMLLTIFTFFQQ